MQAQWLKIYKNKCTPAAAEDASSPAPISLTRYLVHRWLHDDDNLSDSVTQPDTPEPLDTQDMFMRFLEENDLALH